MAEESMSIEELTVHVGIDPKDLDQQVSQNNLSKFAKNITNWEQYAKPLGLTDQHIIEIRTDQNLNHEMKTIRALEKWKKRNAFKATYKRLVTVCLEQDDAELAVEVCKLLKDDTAQSTSKAPSGTQAVLLSRLRSGLVTLKQFPDTASKAETVKEFVLDFATKCIQVDQSLDDLKRQLICLFRDELLFSEDVLKEAEALADKEHAKRLETTSAKPTSSKPLSKEPLFSKDTVYHADICCRVLAACDAGNYQSFFKKLPNGQGHSFKAVSMSRSKLQRLLVAEQGESVFYFAFESCPQLSDWKAYKSFDEGVMMQSQQFPIRYIVELLNKQCRIVITGFSFGGLLASSVTAMVWNLPYISSDLLKNNLTCITFGKPHVSVRVVQTVAHRRPEIASTIHSIYTEDDVVPSLMSFLDESWSTKELSESESGRAGIQMIMAPFQDPVTSSIIGNLQKIQVNSPDSSEAVQNLQSKLDELKSKALVRLNLPEKVYQVLRDTDVGLLFKCLINEKARELKPNELNTDIFTVHSVTEYSRTVFISHLDKEPVYSIPPAPKHAPQELHNLLPLVREVHMHHHGDQTAIVIEGANMWFCQEVSLLGHRQKVPAQTVSGSSIRFKIDVGTGKKEREGSGHAPCTTPVMIYSHFSSKPAKQEIPLFRKGYGVTTRQEQLAKLSPSKVIELGYLSALLEQDPDDTSIASSHKFEVIAKFLSEVVKVVPFESIVFAIAYSSYDTAVVCYEALANCGVQPPVTEIMHDGLLAARYRMQDGIPPQVSYQHFNDGRAQGFVQDLTRVSNTYSIFVDHQDSGLKLTSFPQTILPTLLAETTIPLGRVHTVVNKGIGKSLETLADECFRSSSDTTFAQVVSNLNIELLYPMNSQQIVTKTTLKSPISILVTGRKELSRLTKDALTDKSRATDLQHQTRESNKHMLEKLNKIRKTDLEVCTSLLGGFMEQQDMNISLVKSQKDSTFAFGLLATATIGVWALFSLDYALVKPIIAQCNGEKLLIKILDYVQSISGVSSDSDDSNNSSYAAKLQFVTQGMTKTVTCNTQYVSYSLERQLVELCKSRNIDASISLKDLENKWGKLFKENTLSLVDRPFRPLIGRWLKWALMIHDLREELARYTAVGVTGLVNSGKSKLINTLFGIKVPIGTTEEKRTTIPFIYNLDKSVEGLNVVDFPGVDDEDDTIGDLADLLITVAQIIIFVVDYRKVHTQSSKKWLERLHKEKVPVLVCLTFGDKLYAEHIDEKGVHLPKDVMSTVIRDQLSATEAKLRPTGSHKVSFFSFAQDNDSVLNTDKGREKLKDVGIGSPLQVGEWLVEVFKRDFDNEKLADQLEPFMHTNASQ